MYTQALKRGDIADRWGKEVHFTFFHLSLMVLEKSVITLSKCNTPVNLTIYSMKAGKVMLGKNVILPLK